LSKFLLCLFYCDIIFNMNTITVYNKSIKISKEPVVVVPLKKWRAIESELEDLEMYRSAKLAREIAVRRKEKATVPLEKLLKKYRI